MGAVVLPDLDRCRRSRLHRHIGRNGGYRPLPVLCLRRDLPGPADPGPYDLQDMRRAAVHARQARHARACPGHPRIGLQAVRKTWMAGTSPGMTEEMDLWRS